MYRFWKHVTQTNWYRLFKVIILTNVSSRREQIWLGDTAIAQLHKRKRMFVVMWIWKKLTSSNDSDVELTTTLRKVISWKSFMREIDELNDNASNAYYCSDPDSTQVIMFLSGKSETEKVQCNSHNHQEHNCFHRKTEGVNGAVLKQRLTEALHMAWERPHWAD
jgi:hypothetical protein